MNLNKKNTKQIMFLILFASLMLWVVFNYKLFIDLLGFLIKLVMPLIVGVAIAFVINVPMKQLERKVFKIERRKNKKMIRVMSLILSIVFIIGIVGLISFLVIPEFVTAVSNISKSISKSNDLLNDIMDKINSIHPDIKEYVNNIDLKSIINSWVNNAGNIVSIIAGFLSNMISRLITLFIGFIVSIYILLDKENLARQSKKILMAFFNEEVTVKVVKVIKLANTTFANFLTGQCLDASLIGFLLFIVLSILRLPYALILGVLFAITALIPYVGAFITLFIGVVLIGVTKPIGALWYVITFFVLQQFDDNFTYPRIVGGSVGLPPLWALVAVLVGGSIFGLLGMIISIPLASILYSLLKQFVNDRIRMKNNK